MHLKNSKIIIIKIGSSLLVDKNRKIRSKWLSSFAKDIKKLKSDNKLISSSAPSCASWDAIFAPPAKAALPAIVPKIPVVGAKKGTAAAA